MQTLITKYNKLAKKIPQLETQISEEIAKLEEDPRKSKPSKTRVQQRLENEKKSIQSLLEFSNMKVGTKVRRLKSEITEHELQLWINEADALLLTLTGKGLIIGNKCKICGGLVFPHLSENRPLAIQQMLNKYGDWYITQYYYSKKTITTNFRKTCKYCNIWKI